MRINTGILQSNFYRRIFLLFVTTAVLPVSLVILVSYNHVSDNLRRQSLEQSRQLSKSIGMELYERLSFIATELRIIADSNYSAQTNNEIKNTYQQYSSRFYGITILRDHIPSSSMPGISAAILPLNKRQHQHLTEGKVLIHTYKGVDDEIKVIVATLLNQGKNENEIVVGMVNTDYLWSVSNLLSEAEGLAIIDRKNGLLFNSESFSISAVNDVKLRLADSITGYFESETDNHTNHIAFWSLFTEDKFSMPEWTIAVIRSERDALLPIDKFRNMYIPALILVMIAVSYVSAVQIRRKLSPIFTLKDSTRRITGGDYSERVDISGNDEIAELGSSFNIMVDRVEMQIKSLKSLAELDRLILSSFNSRYIVGTALNLASDITHCDVSIIIEISEESESTASILDKRIDTDFTQKRILLNQEDIRDLTENSDFLHISSANEHPEYVRGLLPSDIQTVILFPMHIGERLAAISIFSYSGQYESSIEEMEMLRKFSDHVAVALSNSMWEERLYHQAHYDSLTGLPNRALLVDRLEQAIARAQSNGCYVGIAFLDIDRFKTVNDSLGHRSGDLLLKKISENLKDSIRNIDSIVRFGGDEFIVVIPDIDRKTDFVYELGTAAHKLINSSQQKVSLNGYELYPEISVGIAVYPKDGETTDELIRNADTAMYHAKSSGRGLYRFYSPDLNSATLHRLTLESELREALNRNEFVLYYQPKISSGKNSLTGAEALIRWDHHDRGILSPSEFIDIAEDTGLIIPISEWVLRTACSALESWLAKGFTPIRISVNIPPNQFNDLHFPDTVKRILSEHNIRPDFLELEVTETTVMENTDKTIDVLKSFKNMGIRISVDDFGTGYSSLSYLRRLPVTTIKIDRSFITEMMSSQETRAIVSSTIQLAHRLSLDVVAEGVETKEQMEFLTDWGCDEIQGYYYSKPLPKDRFEDYFLNTHNNCLRSTESSNSSL